MLSTIRPSIPSPSGNLPKEHSYLDVHLPQGSDKTTESMRYPLEPFDMPYWFCYHERLGRPDSGPMCLGNSESFWRCSGDPFLHGTGTGRK